MILLAVNVQLHHLVLTMQVTAMSIYTFDLTAGVVSFYGKKGIQLLQRRLKQMKK